MVTTKKKELRKMTKKELEAKLAEMESVSLELRGEGRKELLKPVKKTIARIKTYLSQKGEA